MKLIQFTQYTLIFNGLIFSLLAFGQAATERVLVPVVMSHEVNPNGGEIVKPKIQRFLFKHRAHISNSTYVAGPWIVKVSDAKMTKNDRFSAKLLFEERTTSQGGGAKKTLVQLDSDLEKSSPGSYRVKTHTAQTLKSTSQEVWRVDVGDTSENVSVAIAE